MNVFYLSYDGMTDPLGQSQVLPYLIGLSRAGHRISLISFEKQKRFAASRDAIQNICNDHNIHWHPQSYTKRPPVLSTVLDVMTMRRKAFSLHRTHNFDVVHCRSYIAALVGLWMKRTYGLKFVFDMRGFWADERVEGNLWRLNNPLYNTVYKYFKRKEKEFLSEADCTVSLTENAAHEIHTWKDLPYQPIPIEVIPCCADMTLFDPQTVTLNDKLALRKELGIGEHDFVLSYIGSLGTWYMLDEMLDFFSALLQRKPDAKFLVITNDPEINLHEKARSRNIPKQNIMVTQSPRKRMPLHIALSNATLFFIRPTFSKKASSPVKQGEAMGMGIPIVCNAGVGDTDDIVLKSEAGIVIENFSRVDYEKAIDELLNTTFDATGIRRNAMKYYALEEGIAKYLRVYERINNRSTQG